MTIKIHQLMYVHGLYIVQGLTRLEAKGTCERDWTLKTMTNLWFLIV